jgi:uncharacterized protein (TIGR03067 family)
MMLAISLCVALVLAIAVGPNDDANAIDLKRMQGDWMVASMKVNGMKVPDDEAQALFRSVDGQKYTVSHFSKPIGSGTFKIDATKEPKTIDSTPQGKDKPLLGIYQFDGPSLKICNAAAGKPRPTGFAAGPASEQTLIVWQPETK